jgi:mono/diheme cytochrome c family protein
MKKIALFIFVTLFAGFISCESNTYQEIEAKAAVVPTYLKDIKPIIDANCISCHYPNSGLAPFSLTDYQSVRNTTEFGELIYRIESATGELAMPLGGQKLTFNQIESVKLWANQGYQN